MIQARNSSGRQTGSSRNRCHVCLEISVKKSIVLRRHCCQEYAGGLGITLAASTDAVMGRVGSGLGDGGGAGVGCGSILMTASSLFDVLILLLSHSSEWNCLL